MIIAFQRDDPHVLEKDIPALKDGKGAFKHIYISKEQMIIIYNRKPSKVRP